MNINLSTKSAAEAKQLLKQQLASLPDDLASALFAIYSQQIDQLPTPPNGMCIQITAKVEVEAEVGLRIE